MRERYIFNIFWSMIRKTVKLDKLVDIIKGKFLQKYLEWFGGLWLSFSPFLTQQIEPITQEPITQLFIYLEGLIRVIGKSKYQLPKIIRSHNILISLKSPKGLELASSIQSNTTYCEYNWHSFVAKVTFKRTFGACC